MEAKRSAEEIEQDRQKAAERAIELKQNAFKPKKRRPIYRPSAMPSKNA